MIITNNLNPIEINLYFFTNNICESTNRTLNMNYKGACKSLLGFENAIKELICVSINNLNLSSFNTNKVINISSKFQIFICLNEYLLKVLTFKI